MRNLVNPNLMLTFVLVTFCTSVLLFLNIDGNSVSIGPVAVYAQSGGESESSTPQRQHRELVCYTYIDGIRIIAARGNKCTEGGVKCSPNSCPKNTTPAEPD